MTVPHGINMGFRGPGGRILPALLGLCLSACAAPGGSSSDPSSTSNGLLYDGEETYLAGPRQLTFEGQNAEAYFAPGDQWLVFQATPDSLGCDQIFTMRLDGSEKRMVSTGDGVTTCGYFIYPVGDSLLFSSTHLAGPECPPRPDYSRGYVWPIHPGYDVFVAATDGSGLRRLTETPGYDAEATLSRDGSRIVFTSVRDGDLEIYTMARDGSD
ncbi:MAG: TolB family protein, partial [Acidimicrobiia bacterium]